MITEFFVPGTPIPQGSMRAFNNRLVHVNAKALKDWRGRIENLYRGELVDGAVAVKIVFTLPRPRTVSRPLPCVRPDLDKLIRGVLDALTGTAFHDDAQVVSIIARKEYGPTAGARVTVGPA